MFPALRQTNRGPKNSSLSDEQAASWCDQVVLPAIREIAPDGMSHWPLNANHRLFTARRANGQLVLTGTDVQASLVPGLIDKMRSIVNDDAAPAEVQAFRGFILYWEVQGIKLRARYALRDGEDVRTQFETHCVEPAFAGINEALLKPEKTFVDVAIEKGVPGRSLYFSTTSHAFLIRRHCNETEESANRMVATMGKGPYQRDPVATINYCSGFRLNYHRRARRPSPVVYMQAYHTDKNLVYQSSSSTKTVPLRTTSLLEVPGVPASGFTKFANAVDQVFANAQRLRDTGGASRIRLEVTLPLVNMRDHNMEIGSDELTACVFSYPMETML